MKVFFLDKDNTEMSRLWAKQITLHNVSGPHPIRWKDFIEQKLTCPEQEGIL